MSNLYIYCEGQTEETFINTTLVPYLLNSGIYCKPIVCETKRKNDRKYSGGVSTYSKIKKELTNICSNHKNELVTTLFDYYGMPQDTPGIQNNDPDLYKRISSIEKEIEADINKSNLLFNFALHEFEGFLFSNPQVFDDYGPNIVNKITEIRNKFLSPEHINDSYETAPSRRITNLIPDYSKTIKGPILAKNIGIDRIMQECPHFKDWITRVRNAIKS